MWVAHLLVKEGIIGTNNGLVFWGLIAFTLSIVTIYRFHSMPTTETEKATSVSDQKVSLVSLVSRAVENTTLKTVNHPSGEKDETSCTTLKKEILALDLKQWSKSEEEITGDIINLDDVIGFTEKTSSLFKFNHCKSQNNSVFSTLESKTQHFCTLAYQLGPKAIEPGSITEEDSESNRAEKVYEWSALGSCLNYLVKFRLESAREFVNNNNIQNINDTSLLLNAVLGEIFSGKPDLVSLETLLERAYELNPNIESVRWRRTQIAYVRMLEDPNDSKLQEWFTELASKVLPEHDEEKIQLSDLKLHQAILNRDWNTFETELSARPQYAVQHIRFMQAWRNYVEGDQEGTFRLLNQIIYREGNAGADKVIGALTAKKRIENLGFGTNEYEIFSPPRLFFSISFLFPARSDGSRALGGNLSDWIGEDNLKDTPEKKAAFEEAQRDHLMVPLDRVATSTEETR